MSDDLIGDRHVIRIHHDEGDFDVEVWHPGNCPFTINGIGTDHSRMDYTCGAQWELDNVGPEDCFGEYADGFYVVIHTVTKYPGGYWGATEYDSGFDVQPFTLHDVLIRKGNP